MSFRPVLPVRGNPLTRKTPRLKTWGCSPSAARLRTGAFRLTGNPRLEAIGMSGRADTAIPFTTGIPIRSLAAHTGLTGDANASPTAEHKIKTVVLLPIYAI